MIVTEFEVILHTGGHIAIERTATFPAALSIAHRLLNEYRYRIPVGSTLVIQNSKTFAVRFKLVGDEETDWSIDEAL